MGHSDPWKSVVLAFWEHSDSLLSSILGGDSAKAKGFTTARSCHQDSLYKSQMVPLTHIPLLGAQCRVQIVQLILLLGERMADKNQNYKPNSRCDGILVKLKWVKSSDKGSWVTSLG